VYTKSQQDDIIKHLRSFPLQFSIHHPPFDRPKWLFKHSSVAEEPKKAAATAGGEVKVRAISPRHLQVIR